MKRPRSRNTKGSFVSMPLVDRFLGRYTVMPSACWLWNAATDGRYGTIRTDGKQQTKAHRASWMVHFGPIPKGKHVLHRCDNTLCVNPEHLFLGTHADNMRDMRAKGREKHPSGSALPHTRLTVKDRNSIRVQYANGVSAKTLAASNGVSVGYVYDIVSCRKAHPWRAAKETP